jgi:DNA modification methylase
VLWVDVDDERARRILVADNRTAELASWDDAELLALLVSLDDLRGTGFSQAELEAMRPPTSKTDPDSVVEPPEEPISARGDLWLLGPHRLLCGDSTDPADVARLMAGKRAGLMATDPPYLVDYDGANHLPPNTSHVTGPQDRPWDTYIDASHASDFFTGFLAVALAEALIASAPIYQWHATRRQALVEAAWIANGLLVHQTIIWTKDRATLTRSHFLWQHEPCFYGWVKGCQPSQDRRPPNDAKSVWPVNQVGENDGIHPTQKPVELFRRPMEWHLRRGELAFEPFSGSGTAIIAAHMTGRICAAMELSPTFVDVACRRYQEHTGTLPVRERDGNAVDFEAER